MSTILVVVGADAAIPEIREVLQSVTREGDAGSFFECSPEEGEAALLHRFVAGGAPARYSLIHGKETGGLSPSMWPCRVTIPNGMRFYPRIYSINWQHRFG